jgi:hypothetical protein
MRLFHYTSRGTALEHILPTGRLRFGRLPRTNDPREFGGIWFGMSGFLPEDEDLTARDPFELGAEADELLRAKVHLLCLTEDQPSQGAEQARYGTGPRRARMWAQYSENHTGVCLCFDGKTLIETAESQFGTRSGLSLLHGAVSYAPEGEDPPPRTLLQPEAERDLPAFIESMVEQNPGDLFFRKDWDWDSETEYRLLLRGDTQEEEFLDVREALEAVIVGQQFHPVYKPGVYKLCEELAIDALEIQWQMGPPIVVKMIDPARRRLTDPVPYMADRRARRFAPRRVTHAPTACPALGGARRAGQPVSCATTAPALATQAPSRVRG